MSDSAGLKIDRASKHINELSELFDKKRPFSYILETNTKTGKRSTFAKKNEAVIKEASLIFGDIIQNLRTSLDHAYWDIVSPFAANESELRKIQFPFSKTADTLNNEIKNRLANKVSPSFQQALRDLKPHGEPGGNEFLYLVHKLNLIDKHKRFIPTGDYTRISSDIIRAQVPDFPDMLVNFCFGSNGRDVVWPGPILNRSARRARKLPVSGILEQELNVPVDIVFKAEPIINPLPVIPTLYQMIDVTKSAIEIIKRA